MGVTSDVNREVTPTALMGAEGSYISWVAGVRRGELFSQAIEKDPSFVHLALGRQIVP